MATKTKEPTRIEHLAETIAEHHRNLAAMETKAAEMDADAAKAEARIEAMATDLQRPAEGLAQDFRALRETALMQRDGAQLLRKRMAAYREEVQLDSIEFEHRKLVSEERASVEREANLARHAALSAEFETCRSGMAASIVAKQVALWRLEELARELGAFSQALNLPAPPDTTEIRAGQWAYMGVTRIEAEARQRIGQLTPQAHADIVARLATLPKLEA